MMARRTMGSAGRSRDEQRGGSQGSEQEQNYALHPVNSRSKNPDPLSHSAAAACLVKPYFVRWCVTNFIGIPKAGVYFRNEE